MDIRHCQPLRRLHDNGALKIITFISIQNKQTNKKIQFPFRFGIRMNHTIHLMKCAYMDFGFWLLIVAIDAGHWKTKLNIKIHIIIQVKISFRFCRHQISNVFVWNFYGLDVLFSIFFLFRSFLSCLYSFYCYCVFLFLLGRPTDCVLDCLLLPSVFKSVFISLI